MHVGRGRGRSREMMARGGAVNRMVVDHRPRALAIVGVSQEEKDELMPHFVVRTVLLFKSLIDETHIEPFLFRF